MRVIALLALPLVCALHIPPSRRRVETEVGPPVAIRVISSAPLADVHPRFIYEDISEEELEERGWSGSWLSTSWDDVNEEELPWCDEVSSSVSSMTATSSVAPLSGGGVLAVQGGQTGGSTGGATGSGGGIIEVVVITSTVVVAPAATASDVSGEEENPASMTTTSSPPPAQTSLSAQDQQFLDAHNIARAQYNAGNLTWSSALVARAQANAENCDAGKHTNSGENMASQSGALTPAQAVQMWVSEAADYDQNNPGFSEATGHFTQVVWKSTTQIGCFIAQCDAGVLFPEKYGNGYKATCEYDPPGNVVGDNNLYFKENVAY